MFFEGITTPKVCIKIELSQIEWVSVLLLVIFDDFGMMWIPNDQLDCFQQILYISTTQKYFGKRMQFSAEERARKNEHGFSFLEAVKVYITRISIFLQTKNAQTRTDS